MDLLYPEVGTVMQWEAGSGCSHRSLSCHPEDCYITMSVTCHSLLGSSNYSDKYSQIYGKGPLCTVSRIKKKGPSFVGSLFVHNLSRRLFPHQVSLEEGYQAYSLVVYIHCFCLITTSKLKMPIQPT